MSSALADGPTGAWCEAAEKRLDDGAQRLSDWRGSAVVRALHRQLASLDACLPPDAASFAAALQPWISESHWYRVMLTTALEAMEQDPLAVLPWRMQPGPLVQAIVLAEAAGGSATLALVSADALAEASARPGRLVFDTGYSLVAVVAGELEVECWQLDHAGPTITLTGKQLMRPGDILACANRTEQIQLRSAPRDAVVLTLAVTGPDRSEPALEFDAGSGSLLRQGVADPVVSRMLALLELASAASKSERLPLLAALSQDRDPQLRWQAMRHWLADDPAAAVARLRIMAQRDEDPAVKRVAAATMGLLDRLRREQVDAG